MAWLGKSIVVGSNWTLATAYRYLGRIDEEKFDFAVQISGIFTKNHIMTNNSLMLQAPEFMILLAN
ncbi:MAG: hypothetical protein QNJ63_23200 [Calothrix sp. MO_192.B10]|nr:hypothetical protein [Calothrix sp. MO_192.B10]